MEVCLLNEDPGFPCFFVKYAGCCILFDCALEETVQDIKTDSRTNLELIYHPSKLTPAQVEALDIVCLSNFQSVLGLPAIFQNPRFRGRVVATEPTIQFGRMLLSSTLHAAQRSESARHVAALLSGDAVRCMDKVESISFDQQIPLFGAATLTATSSGYAIGSCNWVVRADSHSLCYIAPSSLHPNRHPRPLNTVALSHADVALVAGLARRPGGSPERIVADFCANVGSAVAAGGCALVPCLPCGVVFDLLEAVVSHLSSLQINTVPVYFISPAAKTSIAYANIFGNWLNDAKADRLNQPEWPFSHHALTAREALYCLEGLGEDFLKVYREPCVVFTDHPSLRMGNVQHFLRLWRGGPNNALVLIDPDYGQEVLAPLQPLAMRTAYCPMDARLSSADLDALLATTKPRTVLLPDAYTARSISMALSYEDGSVSSLAVGEPMALPMPDMPSRAFISDELARGVELQSAGAGVSISSAMRVTLNHRDRVSVVSAASPLKPARATALHGSVVAAHLVSALQKQGIEAVIEDASGGAVVVTLPALRASVTLAPSSTTIHTVQNERLRTTLRDLVLAQLASF